MSASETEIASNALTLLGAEPIASLLDESERARLCQRHYPKSRNEVLRLVPWRCALKRITLAQDTTGPIFGFTYSYQLPADALRVWATSLDLETGGGGEEWQIEQRKIVTNANTPLHILYVHRVTDVLLFDPLLEKAITYDLAAKLAYPVTQNLNVQMTYEKMRDVALLKAAVVSGQEGTKRRYRSTMLTRDVR